jgi:hypothetical protein
MVQDCPNPGSGSGRGRGRSDIGVVVIRTGSAAAVDIKSGIGAGDETAIYSSNSKNYDDWGEAVEVEELLPKMQLKTTGLLGISTKYDDWMGIGNWNIPELRPGMRILIYL